MPSSYEWGLFLHLLGVFLVAGGAVSSILILAMLRRSETVQDVRMWANLAAIVDRIFPVATILLLATGIWLVSDGNWSWSDGWINVSLIGLVLIAAAAFLIATRKIVAIDRAAADAPDGPVPQVLAAQITDPMLFATSHAATLGTLAIIWNMTTKPGDAQAGIVFVVAIIIGALSAAPMVQRQQAILERRS